MEMLKGAGAMFLEVSGGAVLGSSCESFLESMEKYCMLDAPVLDRVSSVVENLELYVPKMEEYMGDNRQVELLEELKEEVKRGREFLNKLEANDSSWFKARDNSELIELDASLKSLIRKLRLQSALDVKEVLVLEKENGEFVKSTKRKVDEVDETVKDLQRRQEVIMSMMKKQRMDDSANQVGELVEGAALGAALGELDFLTEVEIQKLGARSPWFWSYIFRLRENIDLMFNCLKKTTAERMERLYMPVWELKEFRMSIEDGVSLLRKCPTIQEWTDELKSEYTNKFLAVENTLKVLYNRLPGLQPLKWSCRKCDKSLGVASTSVVGSTRLCQ